MEEHKEDKESFYFAVVPQDSRWGFPEHPKFVISRPIPEKDLEKALAGFQEMHHCKKEDIKVEKIYMPLEEFKKLLPESTFTDEAKKDSILKENEKHKPKSPKSLQDIAAEALVKNPTFFQSETEPKKATEQAKEKIQEATDRLHPKKKGPTG